MFFYVYLLESLKTGDWYLGFTDDLQRRVEEHNKGFNRSTKPHTPWRLLYYEAHLNKFGALRREKYLKTTLGLRALRRMLHEQIHAKAHSSRKSTTWYAK